MIELRWLERPCVYEAGGGYTIIRAPKRLLQYRVDKGSSAYSDGHNRYSGSSQTWSEWRDVPTVREDG